MLSIVKATLEDAMILAPNLRKADQRELLAASGSTPEVALFRGIRESTKSYVIIDAVPQPLAIFGVAKDTPFSRVWMLASDGLLIHRREFLRKSRVIVDRLLLEWGPLGNFVDSRNEVHIKWITWCGFKFPGMVKRFHDPNVDFKLFYRGDLNV